MTAPKEVKIYAARGFFDSSREDETHFCKMIKLEDHDTQVQALKADLEALVKMYGDRSNWDNLGDHILIDCMIKPEDCDGTHGGELARKIAKKHGVEL